VDITDFATALAVRTLQAQLAQSEARVRDLGDANQKLMQAAGASQGRESQTREAHQRQQALLTMVAHELRNPLMPLRLAAHMLDGARTDDAAHARLQATIKGQVSHMARLINDLVDGSRMSSGKFRLERTLVELVPILDLAIETSRPGFESRRQQFTARIPPGMLKVLGDPVRLVQVFGNLLGNASKYTPEGGEVSLDVSRLDAAIVVCVRDNGIGITEEALPHVFEMFVRDAHATEMDGGGLGIGLAVVKELVKAHEGAVTARSVGKGLGSEFLVTLPAAAVASCVNA
jgi:signal transduction histidine kinase